MRVQVLRVSGMPHNVTFWLKDTPAEFVVYIDETCINETGARFFEAALGANVANWRRSPNRRIRDLLSVHTG